MTTCKKCGMIFLPLEWCGWAAGWVFTGKCPKCGTVFANCEEEAFKQTNKEEAEKKK